MNLGQRIKQARLAFQPKMTQQQLADAVGVSRAAVTQWETGATKTLEGENLYRVARVLNVSTDWLLYGAGPGPGPGDLQPSKVVKAVVQQQVIELTEDVVFLAQRIQTLPAQDRAILLAMVESLTHAKQDRSHESEDLRVCDSRLDVYLGGSDVRGPGRWGS